MYAVIEMKRDYRKIIGYTLAFVGAVMIALGVADGQHSEVFEKAVRICLECIGIG